MITDIRAVDKHVLLYDGTTLKSSTLTTGNVTSPFTVDTFSAPQAHMNRGLSLGLTFSTEHLIESLERGVTLPPPVLDKLNEDVWAGDIGHQKRMEALGHTRP
jgi:hypothetical protein